MRTYATIPAILSCVLVGCASTPASDGLDPAKPAPKPQLIVTSKPADGSAIGTYDMGSVPLAPTDTTHVVAGNSFSEYSYQLRKLLSSRFKYPPELVADHASGQALVHFLVKHDGTLVSARIARSSGDPAIDAFALSLVNETAPLPVLPANFATDGDPVHMQTLVVFHPLDEK